MSKIRINKYIASTGAVSRRSADSIIASGRVKINGEKAVIGDLVDGEIDTITLDDKVVKGQERVIIAMYKPRNVMTTLDDPQGRPCIKDLIPERYQGVFPVGRLDFDARGLLVLTNDGDLANRIHHPAYNVPKVYIVELSPKAADEDIRKMEQGVFLDGKMTRRARIEQIRKSPASSTVRITLMQGLKNQIKRMAKAVGLHVVSIKRISVGPVALKGMKPGQIRELTVFEKKNLYKILKQNKKP